ncbi:MULTISPECIES: SCO family protein [unclassified Wenzhouxiangella]|uniref:SCO family protein n=1 Tax=unclassified Wenzhouxiangella TaxID=2613841 RepID=UPI000E3261CE|nr:MULTISPECIES: SCO family protein [unclassified Wenzhouxiangella]RFF27372.1 SCO family protein [Wenzhouxiangella sp. 15181]RFP68800.1 SCO family protein [Wenzhouxiangella sp. 15190]
MNWAAPGRLAPALLAFGLLLPTAGVFAARGDALEISQEAIGNRVSDLTLIDSNGERLKLHDLLERPLGISLIYTGCAHSCSVTTRYLDRVVQTAREAMGEDSFGMLTIGFDHGVDTPESMANHARRHGVNDPDWQFVVAERSDELERLIEQLGFVYTPSPRGFDHTVQVSLLDRDGTLYRQIYGETFEAPKLVEPLKDLVWRRPKSEQGLLAGIGERIRLFCTVYDARGDRYYFDYSMFIGLGLGGLFLLLVGGWTGREVLKRRGSE